MLRTDLSTSHEKGATLIELQEQFSNINIQKEQKELEIQDFASKLEACKSSELKLQSEIIEYQQQINELKNMDENYQKSLNEAIKNYK